MTLKNNRAPFRCYIKLFTSLQSPRSFQAGVTVGKRQIRVKIGDILPRVTLKFDRWHWKTIGHLIYAVSAVCMISLPYANSNLSHSPEMAKLGVDLCDLDHWPLTLTFCLDTTSVNGNNSWKFRDDTMTGTWCKRCNRRTDRQTDGRTDWLKCS